MIIHININSRIYTTHEFTNPHEITLHEIISREIIDYLASSRGHEWYTNTSTFTPIVASTLRRQGHETDGEDTAHPLLC